MYWQVEYPLGARESLGLLRQVSWTPDLESRRPMPHSLLDVVEVNRFESISRHRQYRPMK